MAREHRFQPLIQRALARFSGDWGRVDSLLSTVLPVLVLGSDLPDAERVARAATCQVIPQVGRFATVSFTTRVETHVEEIICWLRSWNGTTGGPTVPPSSADALFGTWAIGIPPAGFNPLEFPPLDPGTGPPNVPAAGVLLFTPQFRPTPAFDAGNGLLIASCTSVLNPLIGITDGGRLQGQDAISQVGWTEGFRVRWDPPLILPAGFFVCVQWTRPGVAATALPSIGVTFRYRETR